MYHALRTIIRSLAPVRYATYAQAEEMYHSGRITQRQWDAYVIVWTWSSSRFGSIAVQRIERLGVARALARIALFRRALEE